MWPQEGIYIPPHTHIFCYKSGTPFSLSGERECLAPYQPLHHSLTFRLHATCRFTFILSNHSKWPSGLLGIFRPLETDEWLEVSLAMKLGTKTGSSHHGMRLLPSRHGAPRPVPLRAPWYHPRAVCVTLFPLGLDALKNVGDHVLLSCPEF